MQCLLIEKTSKTVTVYPSYPSTFNELPLGIRTNHIGRKTHRQRVVVQSKVHVRVWCLSTMEH